MRTTNAGLILLLLTGTLLYSACGGDNGAEIVVDLSHRDLCQKAVSGEQEERCATDDACAVEQFCWRAERAACTVDADCPADANKCDILAKVCRHQCANEDNCVDGYKCTDDANCAAGYLCTAGLCQIRGHCRQCQSDGNCPVATEGCDHGWCHTICTSHADCDSAMRCSAGFCRKPIVADINFCNYGNKDLVVDLDQTKLFGNADACAFGEWAWGDESTNTFSPDDCSMNLRVFFAPPDVGDYYALIEVYSNATNFSPLWLTFHGQAVEAECNEDLDAACLPVCTSGEADFQPLLDDHPEPSCN